MSTMVVRMRVVGLAVILAGLGVAAAGFLYGLPQANDGLDAAQAMYEDEGVMLIYNEAGQLLDRGTPEGASKILALLEQDWQYPVNHKNLDPNDPLVNTRDELMYQYATIIYHVKHSVVPVKLTAADVPITYHGVTYTEAGTYNITVEKYFAELDRNNPIEKQLRDSWSALALALTGSLAGAHANQAAGEIAQATTMGLGAIGLVIAFAGGGVVWASYGRGADAKKD